ncbi:MAG: CapA family protein [Chlorobi bacterium]|nr:CapA family protein [Chlorobiota bacterium]
MLFITAIHSQAQNSDSLIINTKNNKLISIIGVGDIMLGTNYPSAKYLPPNGDCFPLLANVIPILQNADITFGNIEGSFSDTAKLVKHCKDTTKCYAFRMPEKYFNCLVKSGFDIFSLANNHSGDFGEKGRDKTMELIDSAGLYYAGLLNHPYSIFSKDSIIYGFCAFSPNRGTCSITDTISAKQIVKKLNDTCDIVIVSFHGGAEGKDFQHVKRETETFYGENRGNVYEFAHSMINAGADVVFGHGPHVTRAIDVYKKKFIIYSLGNFCTYGRFNLIGPNGIAPIVKININSEGDFVNGKIYPVMQYNGKTEIDTLKRVIKKLKELTEFDFPDLDIYISDDGLIHFK